jgi:hypothetical protein
MDRDEASEGQVVARRTSLALGAAAVALAARYAIGVARVEAVLAPSCGRPGWPISVRSTRSRSCRSSSGCPRRSWSGSPPGSDRQVSHLEALEADTDAGAVVVPGDARRSRLSRHLRAGPERTDDAGDALSGAPARERGRDVVPLVSSPNWTEVEKTSAGRWAYGSSDRSSREASAGWIPKARASHTPAGLATLT